MIVCHCELVNDRAIRTAILAGAASPADLADACGAGRRCGGCSETVERLLAEAATPVRLAVA